MLNRVLSAAAILLFICVLFTVTQIIGSYNRQSPIIILIPKRVFWNALPQDSMIIGEPHNYVTALELATKLEDAGEAGRAETYLMETKNFVREDNTALREMVHETIQFRRTTKDKDFFTELLLCAEPATWVKPHLPLRIYIEPELAKICPSIVEDVRSCLFEWLEGGPNQLKVIFTINKEDSNVQISMLNNAETKAGLTTSTTYTDKDSTDCLHISNCRVNLAPSVVDPQQQIAQSPLAFVFANFWQSLFQQQPITPQLVITPTSFATLIHTDQRTNRRTVLLHEFGHMLGINGHSANSHDIMFPCEQSLMPVGKSLSARDRNTLTKLYLTKDFKVLWKNFALAGDKLGQYKLGVFYEANNEPSDENSEAAQWYRKSADQGLAAAQYRLGMLYKKRPESFKILASEYHWFNLAARHEYYDAYERSQLARDALRKYPEFMNWDKQVRDESKNWWAHQTSDSAWDGL